MEAKKLTENSYMMTDSYGNKLGLALIRGDTILFTHNMEFYPTLETLAKHFKEKLVYTELASNEESVKDIEGFPTRHDQFFETTNATFKEDQIITYKTREGSNVVYVAGWWAIGTNSTFRTTISPKLSTLTDQSFGPYKSRFDCQNEVTRRNKLKNS